MLIVILPNLPHASLRLHALRPATGFDSGLPTSAGADANVSVTSINHFHRLHQNLPSTAHRQRDLLVRR